MGKKPGKFIISLDLEIMWGVRDVATPQTYGEHLRGVHQVLPMILDCFRKYNIKGTFATVGLLFFETKEELLNNLPGRKPRYKDTNLSPYGDYMKQHVGTDSRSDPYHFAPHLIELIRNTPNQEIGTHTFSHYYCLERGQTLIEFTDDISTAIDIANKQGIAITSIIFPRNQVNKNYLEACTEMGITAYRDNEDSWLYAARRGVNRSLVRRFFRLLDAYVNLSGHHCYTDEYMKKGKIINVPSSRFLRPYSSSLKSLEGLRLRRIKNSMTHAAKNGLLYHLWWHPHNFGINHSRNLSFLEKILDHYAHLNKLYGFSSHTMSEVAEILLGKKQAVPVD